MADEAPIVREAVGRFLAADAYTVLPTYGGVNNIVLRVEINNGDQYILRVYNNGNDSRKVVFEHAVLAQLGEMNLSFKIPKALPSIATGETHVVLSNGTEASLFEVIPGKLPKLSLVKEIGRSSGELSTALSKVSLDIPSPNPPYFDIYKVHHAVTRDNFFATIESADFDEVRIDITELVEELRSIEALTVKLLELDLPQQLIHGDLHYDNVLVLDEPGAISGLLDFEFCAMDWRAMELAICLSKYASEKNALAYFKEFISGYMEHTTLTPLEISVLPDLIKLRILSNIVYFVGRARAKEDSISTITAKAATYLQRIRWIQANRDHICDFIESGINSQGKSILQKYE